MKRVWFGEPNQPRLRTRAVLRSMGADGVDMIPIYSAVIVDGELVIPFPERPPSPWRREDVFVSGRYDVLVATESGEEFVGTLVVDADRIPDEPVIVLWT